MRRAFWAILALAPCGAWAQNPLDSLRLEDLSVTRSRPLFAPTRRPPPSVAVDAPLAAPPVRERAAAAPEISPFELLGSAIGPETAFAVLRNKATGKVVRLRRGEDEEGWRLGAISSRIVTLERDGRTQWLMMSSATIDAAAPIAGDANAELNVAPPSLENSKRAGARPDP